MPVHFSSASLVPFLLIVHDLSGNVGLATSINTVTLRQLRSLKNAWLKLTQMVRAYGVLAHLSTDLGSDPPIKRFAQRHTYHSTDAIAARDLGVAIVRQSSGTTSSGSWSNSLGRTDTQTSLLTSVNPPQPTPTPTAPTAQHKRPPSPDHKRRDSDSHGPAPYKRARAASPPGRDRDRWEGHASGRKRYNSPSWDRDRDRDVPPPRRGSGRDHEEEKAVSVPSVISWFVGTLPGPNAFDGK
jgi:cleavage stimulation factor subunit 3